MNNKTILYIIIGILVLGIVMFTLFPNTIYLVKDSGITGNFVGDKCQALEGKTQEEWNEHMSHHPSMYKECLA